MADFNTFLNSPYASALAETLLSASGPSRVPVTLGQALGAGMRAGDQAQRQGLQRQILQLQLDKAKREQSAMDSLQTARTKAFSLLSPHPAMVYPETNLPMAQRRQAAITELAAAGDPAAEKLLFAPQSTMAVDGGNKTYLIDKNTGNVLTSYPKGAAPASVPAGYQSTPGGGYTFVPGGPADPHVIRNIAAEKQRGQFDSVDFSGTRKGLTGDAFLKTIPPSMASIVKAIDEGHMPMLTGYVLKTPFGQAVIAALAQYDPNFDVSKYPVRVSTQKAFATGSQSQNVNAINAGLGHLRTMYDAAVKLGNVGQFPGARAWNAFRNAIAKWSGAPRVNNFNTAKQLVSQELTRIYRGAGGSEQDIQAWSNVINAAQSPQQLSGAIATVMYLMHSKIAALQYQYNRGMFGSTGAQPLLSPEAVQNYQYVMSQVDSAPNPESSIPAPTATPVPGSMQSPGTGLPPMTTRNIIPPGTGLPPMPARNALPTVPSGPGWSIKRLR